MQSSPAQTLAASHLPGVSYLVSPREQMTVWWWLLGRESAVASR